jgi:sigma-E factor negative regulatory protein RseC
MIREWATVVDWHNGIATLQCDQKSGCSACQSKASCGIRIMNDAQTHRKLEFKLPIEQYLTVGQKVEIGISEANLLYSALLIYFVPIIGLILGAALTHWFIGENFAVIVGALAGGGLGFFAAKHQAKTLERRRFYQPIVLQIALPTENY